MSRIAEQLLRRKVLYRDLVGARVRLVQDCRTRGGNLFPRGQVMRVTHSYRGRFNLLRHWIDAGLDDLIRVHPAAFELVKCRVCGCDHLHACTTPDGPCSWSRTEPDLCTACERKGL